MDTGISQGQPRQNWEQRQKEEVRPKEAVPRLRFPHPIEDDVQREVRRVQARTEQTPMLSDDVGVWCMCGVSHSRELNAVVATLLAIHAHANDAVRHF